ncbi:MAG: tyrosine-type recombinase/integrase [Fimbriimonadaceae bacterium]|nr:tyrosine-type recombinase/integrase [Fimbriimonadaceae bacterium]
MRRKLDGTRRPNGTWRIVLTFTTDTGAKVSKYVEAKTQREVQAKAREILRVNEERKPTPTMSVEAFMEWAMRTRFARVASKTRSDYEGLIRVHIVPALGGLELKDLHVRHVDGLIDEIAGRGNARTANLVRSVLRAALDYAAKNDLIPKNPAVLSNRAKEEKAERPMMSREDLDAILDLEPSAVRRTLFRFLADTGLRPEEARTLEWRHLHREGDSWWLTLDESKTAEGRKPIPLSADAVMSLSLIRTDSVYVFATSNGTPFGARNVVRDWHRAIARARTAGLDVPETNLYQLRKLFGREMASKVPDHVLKRLMRHTNVATTKQYYVEAEARQLRDAVD